MSSYSKIGHENVKRRRSEDSEYDRKYHEERRNSGIKGMNGLKIKRELDPELDKRCRDAQLRALETGHKTWKYKFDNDPEFRERMRNRTKGIDHVYCKFRIIMNKIYNNSLDKDNIIKFYNLERDKLNKRAYPGFKDKYYEKYLMELTNED